MKINKIFLLLLTPLLLTSCGNKIYDVKDYGTNLTFKDNFLICHLGDIHLSTLTNLPVTFSYLDKLINSYEEDYSKKPDLLVLNGDTFMDADKSVVDKSLDFFNSFNIPFAFTYGNHDLQGLYSSKYINTKLATCSNSLLKNPLDDNVYGNSNYYVNLMDGNDIKFQLFFMDSNSYNSMEYDGLHQDQIDWYERVLINTNIGKSQANYAKNMVFFHIPTVEFDSEIKKFKGSHPSEISYLDEYCDFNEKVCYGKNNNFIPTIAKYNTTLAICSNHDHSNNIDLYYHYEDNNPIRLIYGSKSSQDCTYSKENMGCVFYSIFATPKQSKKDITNTLYFSLKRVNLTYKEERRVLCENQY